jgi:formyl-CoA transferase
MIKPLSGLRVIEIGQLIAGPFAAKILGDFGADIIKIEPPEKGDPLRKWRLLHEGTSVWWASHARNKRSLTLDLRQPEGQQVVKDLVQNADIVIENFRPGTLEKWGLGFEVLHAINPKLILLRVSGYGQTGPYRDRPGFGAIGEAMGGFRYLSGEPGRPPVRVGVSIGDTLSGLHGVIGVMMALRHREQQGGLGQEIDVALYESVFNMMESLIPEYDKFGVIREPAGARLPGITPSNAYLCQDGRYALISGNGDSIFKRLMGMMGRQDMADDPRFAVNDGRSAHVNEIDDAITAWTSQHTLDHVLDQLNSVDVPCGKSYDAQDIMNDPHYQARDMLLDTPLHDGSTVKIPGVVPKLSQTPGQVDRPAPTLGQHTEEILNELGISADTQRKWRERKII